SFDANGNLYVADFGNGIRKIDAAGTVSTLSMAVDKRVTGVQAGYQTLWVADALGLLKYDVQTGLATRLPSYYESHDFPPPTAGDVELGTPYALADDVATEDVYYTDLRSDTVRRFRSTLASIEHLSGVPREDAVLGNGWMTSGLHGPMGIALDRHGGLFVADSGHKRIMRITGFDRGLHVLVDAFKLLQQNIKPSDYPILIIGNSFTYFNSTARDSIGSLLEQMLRSDRALGSRSPKVVSFSEPGLITGQPSLAREIISKSSFKFVLIIANANDFWGVAPDVAGQLALWHKQEADTVEALKAASIPSMFVLIPEHWMVSPLEVLFGREVVMPVESDYGAFEPLMLGALQGTGAPVLNLFPAMHAYEASPFVKPLYANEDLHPSLAGRVFIATQIARRLEQLKPWGGPRAVH
ncbi:MAG: hypothetical protein JO033_22385, partial [Acidobacteriaceae bacterium]|nr:hypothetical protein [Acidobacteriaceae bacterium]